MSGEWQGIFLDDLVDVYVPYYERNHGDIITWDATLDLWVPLTFTGLISSLSNHFLLLNQTTPQTITASPIFNWATSTRIPYYSATKTLTDSANLTFDGTGLTASKFISNIATGTAPYACTSTTVNPNLNADLWDGYQFSDYLNQAVKTTSSPTFVNVKVGSNSSASDPVIDFLSSGNDGKITYDQSAKEFDFGESQLTAETLYLYKIATESASTGISNTLFAQPTASGRYFTAQRSVCSAYSETYDIASLIGLDFLSNPEISGTITDSIGIRSEVGSLSGTISNGYSIQALAFGAGVFGNKYGVYSSIGDSFGGVSTNGYGFYAKTPYHKFSGTFGISNVYGIYLENQNVGLVSSYAIYTNAGAVRFGDAVTSTSTITGTQLISNVATGTAPLTVASTTKVTNLNADLVDGYDTGALSASGAISVTASRYVLGGATAISHSTSAGYIHLPTGGSANQILKNSGTSGTGAWGTVTESSGALGAVTSITMSGALNMATNQRLNWNTSTAYLTYDGTNLNYVAPSTGVNYFDRPVGINSSVATDTWFRISGTSSVVYRGLVSDPTYSGNVAGGQAQYNEITQYVSGSTFGGDHDAVCLKMKMQFTGNDGGYNDIIRGPIFEAQLAQIYFGGPAQSITGNHLLLGGTFYTSLTKIGSGTWSGTRYGIGGYFPSGVVTGASFTDYLSAFFCDDIGICQDKKIYFNTSINESARTFAKGTPYLTYDGTDLITNATLKTGGYKSSDGTAGATGTITLASITTITVKNGLITAYS